MLFVNMHLIKKLFSKYKVCVAKCIEGVRSRDQRPYWLFETKGRFCIKIEFNSQKTGLLLQHGRRSFVLLLQHGRRDVM